MSDQTSRNILVGDCFACASSVAGSVGGSAATARNDSSRSRPSRSPAAPRDMVLRVFAVITAGLHTFLIWPRAYSTHRASSILTSRGSDHTLVYFGVVPFGPFFTARHRTHIRLGEREACARHRQATRSGLLGKARSIASIV